MADNTYTLKFPKSPKNAVIINIEVGFNLNYDNEVKYAVLKTKALIDTGANATCISSRIAKGLRLENVSSMKISSAQGVSLVPVYEMDLTLPCGTKFSKVAVLEVAGSPNFDVIIGMDILSCGDIALTNDDSDGLVFSMRFPSKKEPIDFSKK